LGVSIGFFIPSLSAVIQWLVGGLYGGYTASNVLKWYWWRFNSYGYFYGMLVGILGALALSQTDWNITNAFPALLALCVAACVFGSLLTAPTDMEVLKKFYVKVRPWGFWGPVRKAAQEQYPAIEANTNFKRDMVNVVVGIVWQTCLVAAPIFLVIHQTTEFAIALTIAGLCTLFLWKNWYQHLQDYPSDLPQEFLVGTSDEHLIKKV
jgi:hypothetical protein